MLHTSLYRKILVPLDGSELAERALGPAISLCEAFSSKCHLLRTISSPSYYVSHPGMVSAAAIPIYQIQLDSRKELLEQERKRAERYLEETAERFRSRGIIVSSSTAVGVAADSILEVAEEIGADLILVSAHQRHGLSRWLAPNTSTLLTLDASCPVLVLPDREQLSTYGHDVLLEEICDLAEGRKQMLQSCSGLDETRLNQAIPTAITMILTALAEERRRGPNLHELVKHHELRSAEQPDLNLLSQVFHQRGALASTTLREEIPDLGTDESVGLLAALAQLVLEYLGAKADQESSLKRYIGQQLEWSSEDIHEASEKTSEMLSF